MPPEPTAVPVPGLHLVNQKWEDAIIVRCSGRLTLEHSAAFKNHVRNTIAETKALILDFKDVTRMDSSGLGALVGIYVSAKKAGCELALVNYNKSIRDLLGLTNLLAMFESCAETGMRIP